jgi:hypothetical protein
MSVGIVMLVHTALDRAGQAARHWAAGGCPVVIHVDKSVERTTYKKFVAALADVPNVEFSAWHGIGASGGHGASSPPRKPRQSKCFQTFHLYAMSIWLRHPVCHCALLKN